MLKAAFIALLLGIVMGIYDFFRKDKDPVVLMALMYLIFFGGGMLLLSFSLLN